MRYYFCGLFILFLSSCGQNKTIKIKGSDTEVNLAVQLAESFHIQNSAVFVSISGGGSGLGIASLMNGTADIANSSRSINVKEVELFEEAGLAIDSFVFAQDAIAFVVAEDLPINKISISDLSKILSGEYKNWSNIIKKDLKVNIYGRQSNSGTHDFVQKKLNIDFSPLAKQMSGNAHIIEAIKADHSGIGYVGAGYVLKGSATGVKVLNIYTEESSIPVSPLNAEMIAQGKYYFQRPLFQYYKAESYSDIKTFLDFEKTATGQQIIKDAGYYPVLK